MADSNSIFVVADFFLNDSNFWCSKFKHTQCGGTCACAGACLHPHNLISNVVASVTIHDDTYIYIHGLFEIYVNVYVYACVHVYVYVCVYVYVP